MFGFKVDQAKSFFFDSDRVLRAVSAARRKVLSKAGAFVRRTAKGLIRKSKHPSKAGRPPHSHTDILKRFLYFAYEPSRDSVIIGPAKTNQIFFGGDGEPVTGTVPEVLEYGGSITVEEAFNPSAKKWYRRDIRYRRAGTQAEWKRRRRTVQIEARPYMGPALAKEMDNFPELWADAVTSKAA